MPALAEAIYRRCDAKDGLADGLIDDPRRCDFDPSAELKHCSGDKPGADCFTAGQIESLKQVYGGPVSRGKPFFPGSRSARKRSACRRSAQPRRRAAGPGGCWSTRASNRQLTFAQDFLRYLAFGKSDPSNDCTASISTPIRHGWARSAPC